MARVFAHVLNEKQTVVNNVLAELRNQQIQLDRERFRNNMRRLGMILAYEVSGVLPFYESETETPLGKTTTPLCQDPVLIAILRAAIPLLDGILDVFNRSDCGFIGAYRDYSKGDDSFEISANYQAFPETAQKPVLLVDPMLATGRSLVKAVNLIMEKGEPAQLHIAAAIGAPEGIQELERELPVDCHLWLGALDEKLNSKAYIVPGLGDAGDLSYGMK